MYFYVAISFNSRLLLHNGHDLVMAVKGMLGKIATVVVVFFQQIGECSHQCSGLHW